jgi:polysaccharide export outer membrane protein
MPSGGTTTPPTLAEVNRALASAAVQTPSSADYHIGAEDLLQITLFNIREEDTKVTPRTVEVRVSQEGIITLPLLGEIPAGGLTTSALEQALGERYEKYIYDPQVGVMVKEYHSQRVSVIGAVEKPGVFELSGPMTLVNMLAMAGGVSERAGSQVHLYRQELEGRQSYVIDLYTLANGAGSVNLPVRAGDVINVPRAGMFFVDGAVRKAGSYPLDRPYTLTQALAVAAGVDYSVAKSSGITIFRRQGHAQVETISVNLGDIRAGKLVDPPVQAGDVIVVPVSTPKYVISRFLGGVGMGVSAPLY